MPAVALPVSREDCIARISTLTGLQPQEILDLLSLPPEALATAMQNYADQVWTKPGNALDDVVAVLGVLATIAGDLTGIGALVQMLRAA